MMSNRCYTAALDLGGTKIAAAVVDSEGNVISRLRSATLPDEGREAVLERMCRALEEVVVQSGAAWQRLKGIGIGVPGAVDWEEGVVGSLTNLPGWEGFALKRFFRQKYDCPVAVDNDANAAALGENLFGAGQGSSEMLYITISTGIGGGIITGGRLTHGFAGVAGEIGHMVLNPEGPQCNCGNYGCWEAISSGTAIAVEVTRRISEGEETMAEGFAADGTLKAEHVFAAYRQQDPLAREVIERAMHYTGLAVANLVNVLNPEKVVIGGGVAAAGDVLFDPVRERLQQLAFGPAKEVVLLPAQLGPAAGVVGAAALILIDES